MPRIIPPIIAHSVSISNDRKIIRLVSLCRKHQTTRIHSKLMLMFMVIFSVCTQASSLRCLRSSFRICPTPCLAKPTQLFNSTLRHTKRRHPTYSAQSRIVLVYFRQESMGFGQFQKENPWRWLWNYVDRLMIQNVTNFLLNVAIAKCTHFKVIVNRSVGLDHRSGAANVGPFG